MKNDGTAFEEKKKKTSCKTCTRTSSSVATSSIKDYSFFSTFLHISTKQTQTLHTYNQLPMLFRPGFNSRNEKNMHKLCTASTFLKVVCSMATSKKFQRQKHGAKRKRVMRCASELRSVGGCAIEKRTNTQKR